MTDFDRWLTTPPEPDCCPVCDGCVDYTDTHVVCTGGDEDDEPGCGWTQELQKEPDYEPEEPENNY